MRPSSRDRISVDLHGLKVALLDRAQALGVSPSGLVRTTLAEALGPASEINICVPFGRTVNRRLPPALDRLSTASKIAPQARQGPVLAPRLWQDQLSYSDIA
jgi:hypothetical protein